MTVVIELPKIKQEGNRFTAIAAVDLRDGLYKAVSIVSGQSSGARPSVNYPSSEGDQILGILMNRPNVGEPAEICIAPCDAPWIASETFDAGTPLMATTAGLAKTATSAKYVGAVAKQPSLAVGHVVAVLLKDYMIDS